MPKARASPPFSANGAPASANGARVAVDLPAVPVLAAGAVAAAAAAVCGVLPGATLALLLALTLSGANLLYSHLWLVTVLLVPYVPWPALQGAVVAAGYVGVIMPWYTFMSYSMLSLRVHLMDRVIDLWMHWQLENVLYGDARAAAADVAMFMRLRPRAFCLHELAASARRGDWRDVFYHGYPAVCLHAADAMFHAIPAVLSLRWGAHLLSPARVACGYGASLVWLKLLDLRHLTLQWHELTQGRLVLVHAPALPPAPAGIERLVRVDRLNYLYGVSPPISVHEQRLALLGGAACAAALATQRASAVALLRLDGISDATLRHVWLGSACVLVGGSLLWFYVAAGFLRAGQRCK